MERSAVKVLKRRGLTNVAIGAALGCHRTTVAAVLATEIGFHPEVCAPGAANQKGSVENLVGFVKSNFLHRTVVS